MFATRAVDCSLKIDELRDTADDGRLFQTDSEVIERIFDYFHSKALSKD